MSATQGQTDEPDKKPPHAVEPIHNGENGEDTEAISDRESDSQQETPSAISGKSQADMTDFVTFWTSIEAGFARGTTNSIDFITVHLIPFLEGSRPKRYRMRSRFRRWTLT